MNICGFFLAFAFPFLLPSLPPSLPPILLRNRRLVKPVILTPISPYFPKQNLIHPPTHPSLPPYLPTYLDMPQTRRPVQHWIVINGPISSQERDPSFPPSLPSLPSLPPSLPPMLSHLPTPPSLPTSTWPKHAAQCSIVSWGLAPLDAKRGTPPSISCLTPLQRGKGGREGGREGGKEGGRGGVSVVSVFVIGKEGGREGGRG